MRVWQEPLLSSMEPFWASRHLREPLCLVWSHQGHLYLLRLPPLVSTSQERSSQLDRQCLKNPFFWF